MKQQTEFGEIPLEWEVKQVIEIKDEAKRAIAMGPFGSNIKAENFVESGVPVIRGTNMNFAKFVDGEFVFLTEKKADELLGSNCHPDDLVFTHRGTIGQVALIPKNKYPRYVISQSGMKLTVNQEVMDSEFLFYFFKSEYGQYQILKYEAQVGVPSISNPLTSLKQMCVPVPPLPEQKAIASVLSSLDDKIDLLHRQNKTLEAMAETLFRQWFIEEAKEDWGLESLGHHIQTINGVSYKSSELNPSNIALVTLKNFGRNGGLRTDGFKEFTGAFKDSQIMEDGDIAVAHTDLTQDASLIGNPIYTLNLLNYDKLVISMDLVKVNLTSNTLTKCFLFHLLKSSDFKDHALACSNGSSVIHLSKKALPSFQFKYPPAERIFSFTNLVEPMDQKIQKNLMQIQTLEKLRDTLLPKLMSGEVRVQYQTEEVA